MLIKVPVKILKWNSGRSRTPVIEVKIDFIKVILLLDTGATHSFLDSKFVNKHPYLKALTGKTKDYLTISHNLGKDRVCDKVLTPKIKFGSQEVAETFYVQDMWPGKVNPAYYYDGILGYGFMYKYSGALSPKEFQLTVRN